MSTDIIIFDFQKTHGRTEFDRSYFFNESLIILEYKNSKFFVLLDIVFQESKVVSSSEFLPLVFLCTANPYVIALSKSKGENLLILFEMDNSFKFNEHKNIVDFDESVYGLFADDGLIVILFGDYLLLYEMDDLSFIKKVILEKSLKSPPSRKLSSLKNRRLFCASKQIFFIIDIATGKFLVDEGFSSIPYNAIDFDGNLIVGATSRAIHVWDVDHSDHYQEDIENTSSILILSDHSRLIAGNASGELLLFQIDRGIEFMKILNVKTLENNNSITEAAQCSVKQISRIGNFICCIMGQEISIWNDYTENSDAPLDLLQIEGTLTEFYVFSDSIKYIVQEATTTSVHIWKPFFKDIYLRRFELSSTKSLSHLATDKTKRARTSLQSSGKISSRKNSVRELVPRRKFTKSSSTLQLRKTPLNEPNLSRLNSSRSKEKKRKKKMKSLTKKATKQMKKNDNVQELLSLSINDAELPLSQCFEEYLASNLFAEHLHFIRALESLKCPTTEHKTEEIADMYLGYSSGIPIVRLDRVEVKNVLNKLKDGQSDVSIFDALLVEAMLQVRDHFSQFLKTLTKQK